MFSFSINFSIQFNFCCFQEPIIFSILEIKDFIGNEVYHYW